MKEVLIKNNKQVDEAAAILAQLFVSLIDDQQASKTSSEVQEQATSDLGG